MTYCTVPEIDWDGFLPSFFAVLKNCILATIATWVSTLTNFGLPGAVRELREGSAAVLWPLQGDLDNPVTKETLELATSEVVAGVHTNSAAVASFYTEQ